MPEIQANINAARVFIPLDRSIGSRDRYGFRMLGPEQKVLLAFIVDAPMAASVDTGRNVEQALDSALKSHSSAIDRYCRDPENDLSEDWRELLYKVACEVDERLSSRPDTPYYAAFTAVVITPKWIVCFTVGDTSMYAWNDQGFWRHSGSSAIHENPRHTFLFDERDQVPPKPLHTAEGVYLGARKGNLSRDSLYHLDRSEWKFLAMMSDGAETQEKLGDIVSAMERTDSVSTMQQEFSTLLGRQRPLDDISVQGFALDF